MADRVLLLMPTTSYRARDFIDAAERLGIEVIVGTDRRQALENVLPGHTLTLDFADPQGRLGAILELDREKPLGAVIGVDDETTVMAALTSEALGLPHNPVASARAARDKYETRRAFAAAGLRGPRFERVSLRASPEIVAGEVGYPCVLKPTFLSASRGVLRADDSDSFVEAFRRVASILGEADIASRAGDRDHLLIEQYLPGAEVALEGLLEGGELRLLALFDKPDPLQGPTFEETLFVTPSRHGDELQRVVVREAARGCTALGLREGPIHAELRLHDGEPWLLEVAARTIGGLCSRALRFGGRGVGSNDDSHPASRTPAPHRGSRGRTRPPGDRRGDDLAARRIRAGPTSRGTPLPRVHLRQKRRPRTSGGRPAPRARAAGVRDRFARIASLDDPQCSEAGAVGMRKVRRTF
jgi:biotin carboxylase